MLSTPALGLRHHKRHPRCVWTPHSRSTVVTIFLVCAHRKLAEVVHVEVFLLSVSTREGTPPKNAETLRPRSIR